MVTEAELVERLRDFLSTSDLETTTVAIVRRKLEEDFAIDLSDKKAFIREQVDLYIQTQLDNQQNDEDEAEDEEEASEVDCQPDDEDEPEHPPNDGKPAANPRPQHKNKEVKKRGGGFTKLCSLSPQLQKFIGVPELARTEVVKQLWQYIREHNLQDPSNRRNIVCDENFHDLFGVDTIDMFQMNKALAKHIWPLDSGCASTNCSSSSPQKEKRRKQDREEDSDEQNRQEKRQKSGNSGILAPLPLSDALVRFLDIEETALPRSDVIKRIWGYIKQNNLQDPSDKRRIICDEKLKELFNVDNFHGFSVAKLLTVHFIKKEH